jgi:hypothetical protein
MSLKAKLWTAGLVVAAAGVILAKLISPGYADRPGWQMGLFLAGVLLAMSGLGLIMMGARKK